MGLLNTWLGYLAGGLLIAVLLLSAGLYASRAELGKVKSDHAAELAKLDATIAKQREDAIASARAAEQKHAAALDAVAQTYEKEKADAQAAADVLVRDLRAGTQRLHDRWQAAIATADLVRRTTSAAGGVDATADDRFESASRAIGAADACDIQVIGLQRVIRADRGQ